jgi:histidine triad (HIT) family protein
MPTGSIAECLFCRIAAGDVPAKIVLEDQYFLAFLDHRPLFPGHCLLISKQHCDTLSDLPAGQSALLIADIKILCSALESALPADGTFVAINNRVSQSVPHLHVHVVPRRRKDGLRGFFWPRQRYRDESEMESVRASVAAAVARSQKPQSQ